MLAVTGLLFFGTYWLLGSPAALLLGQDATPEAVAALNARYGFDRPVAAQYLGWLGNALRGDLGSSLVTEQSVEPITVGRWYSLQFQVDKPPFDDLRLRQAIGHALDREKINDIVMMGRGMISEGPTPPGLWWFDPDLKSLPHDPDKARALLKEAGLEGISVTFSAPQITAFQQITQLVQEQLAAVGITATLEPVSAADWYARIVDQSTNFTPTRWTQRPDPDGLLYVLFHSKGFQNTTNYRVPEVDEMLDKARSTYDQDERRALYLQIQARVTADLPMVPLFFSAEYAAMSGSVQDFRWIPDQIPRFREVWLQR